MVVATEDAIAKVMSLPPEERLQLAGKLWASVAESTEVNSETLSLTDEQVAEFKQRIADMRSDPSIGLTHEEVWSRLRTRDAS